MIDRRSVIRGLAVLSQTGFDAERACRLMGDYAVSNAFIPPTALKMLRAVPMGRVGTM